MLSKKMLCFAIIFVFLLSIHGSVQAECQNIENLPAKSYILVEANTGKVLAEKNADEKMPPASITKIMTMLLLAEKLDLGEVSLDDLVTTSEHANSMGGSQVWLDVGEQMSIEDLLKATAINSANDAAVAISEHIAGSEEQFVELMNQKAAELGMTGSNFCNASGLDADGHLSTARDIAIMGRELIKYPLIIKYTSKYMDDLRNGKTELVNTNKMVRFYEGCNGLKTGTTDLAGSCLCATATRNDMTLIAVSMGSETSKDRFDSCRSLLDYGFAGWELLSPNLDEMDAGYIEVVNGKKDSVALRVDQAGPMLIPKNSSKKVEKKVELESSVEAPVQEGRCCGRVVYLLGDEEISSYDIVADEGVGKVDFVFLLTSMINNFFNGTTV